MKFSERIPISTLQQIYEEFGVYCVCKDGRVVDVGEESGI